MKELLIGIDGDALRAPLSGVGHYIFNLARELDTLLPQASFIAYSRLPATKVQLPSPRWQLRSESVEAFRRIPSFLWLKTRGRAMCLKDHLDVFWAGRTIHPGLNGSVRTISSVHDLNHLLAPETMQFQSRWSSRLWYRSDLLNASCVLTNSTGTAERLRSMLGVKAHGVVYPGVTPQFHPSQSSLAVEIPDRLARLGVKPPYLLSVATSEPRKNLDAVLRAFVSLKKEGKLKNHQLVLAGPSGWKNRELTEQLLAARTHNLVLAGYVPDDLMPSLYALSEALLFPSLYEGFGMPVLEARVCGARVVTSDIPELREAGDEHVIYVEPTAEGVKDGILRAINAPKPPPAPGRTWKEAAKVLAGELAKRGDN
jgi:glycosyltransferase involved in cell wall biosynthesis